MAPTVATEQVASSADAGLAPDELRQIYREMLLTRLLDERMIQLNRAGKAPFVISCQGQEAAQIGAAFALDMTKDWLLPYYRDLGVCLHAGMTPVEVLLALFGKPADPSSGGRQMPAHYGSRRLRIVTGSSPVATQLLHAVGVAYAAKIRREESVSFTSCGEGSTSEGDFHEALNFAAIHRLPVIFFIENNHYAISLPAERQMAVPNVADRAAGYGLPGIAVDGSDPVATYAAMREAVARARGGDGPTLVEAKVARFQPHSGDDDDLYRTREEVAALRQHDPLASFRGTLTARGLWDDTQETTLRAQYRAEIDAADEFAESAPDADAATLFDHVFAMTNDE
ncbi:MAG: thiamine pyrophosphate-dependent dehydrogenase E1 component subunit alpha [Thermomicrobiales bacterium]